MNVLIAASSVNVAIGSGVAAKAIQLARALAATGVEVCLATTDATVDRGDSAKVQQRLGCARLQRVSCVGSRFRVPTPERGLLPEMARRADVAILLSHWSILNALVARAMRRLGKPHVVLPAGALPPTGRSVRLKKLYNLIVGRNLVSTAAAGIATTRHEVGHFREYRLDESRVTIIPNAIEPLPEVTRGECARFRSAHDLESVPYVLFVGRLSPIKGPDLLLAAFEHVARRSESYHLVVAGKNEGMKAALEAEVERAGLGRRVHFIGFIEGREKACCYREATLLVVPSRREAMSLVALEAASLGTPVLLTEDCGFPELALVEEACVVPATVEGLRRSLDAMLAGEIDLIGVGRRQRDLVAQRFSWDTVVRQYRQLLDDVVESHRRS